MEACVSDQFNHACPVCSVFSVTVLQHYTNRLHTEGSLLCSLSWHRILFWFPLVTALPALIAQLIGKLMSLAALQPSFKWWTSFPSWASNWANVKPNFNLISHSGGVLVLFEVTACSVSLASYHHIKQETTFTFTYLPSISSEHLSSLRSPGNSDGLNWRGEQEFLTTWTR